MFEKYIHLIIIFIGMKGVVHQAIILEVEKFLLVYEKIFHHNIYDIN